MEDGPHEPVGRRAILRQLAGLLGTTLDDSWTVEGTALGPRVSFAFIDRGSEGLHAWTTITVDTPLAYPLRVTIRPHDVHDDIQIDRGQLLDLQVGDEEFDRRFLVEAAPSDVVRRLLDAETREILGQLGNIEIKSRHYDQTHRKWLEDFVGARNLGPFREHREIELGVPGWIDNPGVAVRAVEMMVRLAGRVRDAHGDDSSSRIDDGPYRPKLDASAQGALQAKRERELEAVGDRPIPAGGNFTWLLLLFPIAILIWQLVR